MVGDVASERVARELYPGAVAEARRELVVQVLVIAVFVAVWTVTGFPRRFAWTVCIVAPGAVAALRDLRWWLWLRRADPVDGYRRAEGREDAGSPPAGSRASLLLGVVLFHAWWFMAA